MVPAVTKKDGQRGWLWDQIFWSALRREKMMLQFTKTERKAFRRGWQSLIQGEGKNPYERTNPIQVPFYYAWETGFWMAFVNRRQQHVKA